MTAFFITTRHRARMVPSPATTAPPAEALLLNTYPNAATAYSTRRLNNSYTGAAIRVRRSSDNAEQDIGFAGNSLDLLGLWTFVGAADGFVATWYDQSGNGIDLLQANPVMQPRIVIAGALAAENGQPSVDFSDPGDTQPQWLESTATLPNSSNAFVFLAHRKTLSTDNPITFNLNHGNGSTDRVSANLAWSTGHIYWDAPGGSRTTAGPTPNYNDTDMHQYTLTRTGVANEQRIRRDGALLASGGNAGGNLGLNQISIGLHHLGRGADMRVSEMVVYLQNMFADMAGIESDQQTHFSTP